MIRIRTPVTVVIAGPPGRRVRHRLTPTRRGSVAAHPCRHRPHRGCTDRLVGARRCLARRATGAANTRGMHRPVRRSCWHRHHRPTGGLPALPGRWVRHRLTPTRRGSVAAHPCRHRLHRGCTDRLVGARRCLARRASRRGILRGMHRPVRRSCWHRHHRPTGGLPALPGRWVRHRLTPTTRGAPSRRTPIPDRGWVVPPCRGEALPRPPHLGGAATSVPATIPAGIAHATVDIRPHRQFWPCEPAGQVAPDPYNVGCVLPLACRSHKAHARGLAIGLKNDAE
jgi:hypothetical protein